MMFRQAASSNQKHMCTVPQTIPQKRAMLQQEEPFSSRWKINKPWKSAQLGTACTINRCKRCLKDTSWVSMPLLHHAVLQGGGLPTLLLLDHPPHELLDIFSSKQTCQTCPPELCCCEVALQLPSLPQVQISCSAMKMHSLPKVSPSACN